MTDRMKYEKKKK